MRLYCLFVLFETTIFATAQITYDLDEYGSAFPDEYQIKQTDVGTDERPMVSSAAHRVANCITTLSKPSEYRLDSSLVVPWYMSLCQLYIRAPTGHHIVIEFPEVQLSCGRSHAIAVDGWLMINWFSGQRSHVPWFRHRKVHSLCAAATTTASAILQRQLQPQTFVSSTNTAQLLYSLENELDSVTITVKFVPDSSQICDQVIDTNHLENQELSLSAQAGESCRLYIAGGAHVTLAAIKTSATTETSCNGSKSPTLTLRSAESGWSSTVHLFYKCELNGSNNQCADIKSPCPNSVIELDAGCADASVRLNLKPLSDEDREPNAYYCSRSENID